MPQHARKIRELGRLPHRSSLHFASVEMTTGWVGTKGRGGLRPSFSAHVRWCEHGAPVRSCGTRSRLRERPAVSNISRKTRKPKGGATLFLMIGCRGAHCRSTELRYGRDDKERVVAHLENCNWDGWTSGGK